MPLYWTRRVGKLCIKHQLPYLFQICTHLNFNCFDRSDLSHSSIETALKIYDLICQLFLWEVSHRTIRTHDDNLWEVSHRTIRTHDYVKDFLGFHLRYFWVARCSPLIFFSGSILSKGRSFFIRAFCWSIFQVKNPTFIRDKDFFFFFCDDINLLVLVVSWWHYSYNSLLSIWMRALPFF